MVAILIRLATLDDVLLTVGPFICLHHLQDIVDHPFLGAGLSEPPPFARILVTHASPGLVAVLASAFLALAFALNCLTMASQSEAVLGLNEVLISIKLC